ncbi:MAG TPA: ribosomal protein S18-alanine N-acetyltransferase [Mobilitalea sp.]|nr:ribosomal protein S18-alanine N-acetyltransferase [Mobilitalea sp.]
MLVREMKEADLASICAIENETFSAPWSEEDFFKSFHDENNSYLVTEEDGKIVGYCGYWGIAGEGNIYNVAVKKEYRRQGVGFLMLCQLIKQARERGITSCTLEVRQSNEAAIRLYERLGFESVGIRRGFYTKPPEDAVIMWLRSIQ